MYIYTYPYLNIHVYACIYMIWVCMYIHTYISAYIHIYINT